MTTQTSIAEQFGQSLGHRWRAYQRSEQRLVGWFAARGMPVGVVTALLWTIKLGGLALLLYVAFWFAILLIFVVFTSRAAALEPVEEESWPAVTDLTELRNTLGYDPNLYNDISHEMYTDD